MTFSQDTKKELASQAIHSKVESLMELSGLARMNASLSEDEPNKLLFCSENRAVIERVRKLLFFLYPQGEEEMKERQFHNQYQLSLDHELTEDFLRDSGLNPEGGFTIDRDRLMSRLKNESNASSYLRGAFLGGGSITDPNKSYHLEIVLPNTIDLDFLLEIFTFFELKVKTTQRKKNMVVYFKDSEEISEFLVIIGANQAMLILEDVKVRKDLRNDINRQVNADTANINKVVTASMRQISAIDYIKESKGLDFLDQSLEAIARLRMEYPEVSLRQLGEKAHPPLSKSGVNHRMKKILEQAEDLGWKPI